MTSLEDGMLMVVYTIKRLLIEKKPTLGITELKYIDPRKIKKIREEKNKNQGAKNLEIVDEFVEYYFNEKGVSGQHLAVELKSPDTIAFCPSGLVDAKKYCYVLFT